jgi:hypothetical protein
MSAFAIAPESWLIVELPRMQQALDQRKKGGCSTALIGMNTMAILGDFDVALHDYKMSSGRITTNPMYTAGYYPKVHPIDLTQQTMEIKVNNFKL